MFGRTDEHSGRIKPICETPATELQVSAGSLIVDRVVNPLKPTYPFIDLLQPAGELLAFLQGLELPEEVWRKIGRTNAEALLPQIPPAPLKTFL